jgi:hypothetical protein
MLHAIAVQIGVYIFVYTNKLERIYLLDIEGSLPQLVLAYCGNPKPQNQTPGTRIYIQNQRIYGAYSKVELEG